MCCGAVLHVVSDDNEGTSYYRCDKCLNPTDPKSESVESVTECHGLEKPSPSLEIVKVQRYKFKFANGILPAAIYPADDGSYVDWDDYMHLEEQKAYLQSKLDEIDRFVEDISKGRQDISFSQILFYKKCSFERLQENKKLEEQKALLERRVKELEKDSYECTCTDPKTDPYGSLCRYCYCETAKQICTENIRMKEIIAELRKLKGVGE